jgi:exodeoxyribonuclease-3
MKFFSWNVNGLRAVLKKGLTEILAAEDADFVCFQETKAHPSDVDYDWSALGYQSAEWNWAEKKGYSGVLTLSKQKPLSVTRGIGIAEHDREGRVVTTEFADFFLVNVYVPNSQRELARLDYRQKWDADFLSFLCGLQTKKPVIFCGDLNVAHTAIDLARPKDNERNHGFTIEERTGFSANLKAGFLDTFREFEPGGGHYTWWSVMSGARAKNIGWRIDYFLCSAGLRPRLKSARIYPHITGSDHCPVGIELA